MASQSMTAEHFATSSSSGTGPSLYQPGSTSAALVEKIKEMYRDKTVPTLAAWLRLTIKTARNRLEGHREFTLEEVERLLHSEQGFEILSALMGRAVKKPHWWSVCEPLMEFVSIEQMQAIVQKRVAQAIKDAAHAQDTVTKELRRAQTMAIHDPEFHQPRIDALSSYAGADNRVVDDPKTKR
jgi:hypothetical protein